MRQQRWFGLLVILALLPGLVVQAQFPPMPPAIVQFSSDRATITLPESEAGDQTATFSWEVINLVSGQRLTLERMELNGWASELYPDEQLTPTGTRPGLVKHPLNFGVPTYRLTIVDADDNLLDAQYITIPYVIPPDTKPFIEGFSTSASGIYSGDLEQGQSRVNVAWTVNDRLPTSNLLFEQLLADGSAVSIELPRSNLWIASSGSGVVAPVLPQGENQVRLRLRVADIITGEIYDSAEMELPVTDTPPAAIATLVPTRQPPATPLPPSSDFPTQVISFTASPSPADPAGLVTLSWTVRGADSVSLEWMNKQGDDVAYDGLPLEGTFDLALADVQFSGKETSAVRLIPKDANGNWITDPNQAIVGADLWIPLTTNLRIVSFTASPNPVARDGTITFNWNVENAASVHITRINPQGILTLDETLRDALPPSGTITIPVAGGYSTKIGYLLGASDANGVSIGNEGILEVNLICPFQQFIAPSCPLIQKTMNAAFQTFQGGSMIWRGDSREILVLYDDSTYAVFEDTWAEGETIVNDTPPDGLIAPERGFGKVWANNPEVKAKLGWASGTESSYTMSLETYPTGFGRYPTTDIYFTLPDGLPVHMTGFPRQWEIPAGN